MFHSVITDVATEFRTSESVSDAFERACRDNSDIARHEVIGNSVAGRPISAVVLGSGPKHVSLLAGAHSDEPAGPETLRTLILQGLANREQLQDLFSRYTFLIIPHINPDGEAINQSWISQWPDLPAYLQHAFRELPGLDLEFGYPAMRPENRHVAAFLKQHAPLSLHMSLHGMAFSEGAFLLIERHWIERASILQAAFAKHAADIGLGLHDHDRQGEKGFIYIGPGFTTTPEGRAMQAYFNDLGDSETAAKFHLSSMEFVRDLGGDPLCLVTELPLFNIARTGQGSSARLPEAYLAFKAEIPDLLLKLRQGESIAERIDYFQISPLPVDVAIRSHLYTIDLALQAIEAL